MTKTDFKKTMRYLFAAPRDEFEMITVPKLSYLGVIGQGDPNTSLAYSEAVQALFAVAYTLKFGSKNQLGKDYVVPPLEGLWYSESPAVFREGNGDGWQWTMMLMTPDWITTEMIDTAIATTRQKKNPKGLDLVRPIDLEEGMCLQILHVGPYHAEGPTLQRLHNEHMPALGLVARGHHHEIYLNDPARTEPQKLRTILRQPVSIR